MLRSYKCPWVNLTDTQVLNQCFEKINIFQLLEISLNVNMISHTYNMRNNSLHQLKENISPENNTVPNKTMDRILCLQKIML